MKEFFILAVVSFILRVATGQQHVFYSRNQFDSNWADAIEFCEGEGGFLPIIKSLSEHNEILSLCETFRCWIGLSSPPGGFHAVSTWQWIDNSIAEDLFSEWSSSPGGPPQLPRCAKMTESGWEDDHCERRNGGVVCQFDDDIADPPSPIVLSPVTPPSPQTPTEAPTEVVHPPHFFTISPVINTPAEPATMAQEESPAGTPHGAEEGEENEGKQRHIIFILTDDMGFSDVSYNGAEYETPHIDALAAESVRLRNYYVQQTCSPTRAALFTGRQPAELGLQNDVFAKMLGTSLSEPFLSEKLHDLGYKTHLIGKWHLAYGKWDDTPIGKGFDTFFGLFGGYFNYFTHDEDGSSAAKCSYQYSPPTRYVETSNYGYDLWDYEAGNPQQQDVNGEGAGYRYEGIYATRLWNERAIDIIREYDHGDQPLFIMLAHNAPHEPWQVPFEYYNHTECAKAKSETRRIYCGMVRSLDESIGDLVHELKVADLYDDTYIIFSSDNGGAISTTIEFKEPPAQSNSPLRCGKTTVFEGGQRVIGFIKGPTLTPRDSEQLFHVSDWFLTLQTMAGDEDTPATIKVRGTESLISSYNQWPALHFPEIDFRDTLLYNVFWDFETNSAAHKGAVRDLEYKLIVGGNQFTRNGWFDASERRPDRVYCLGATNCSKKPSILWFKISEDPEEAENNGDGRQTPPTDPEEYEHYEKLVAYWREWQANAVESTIPEIEDREFDAQAYAELWNCHWQPWISTNRFPIELDSARDCHSSDRIALQCREGCTHKDCWKCAAGWPNADENNCPPPQPQLSDIPAGFSDVFGTRGSIDMDFLIGDVFFDTDNNQRRNNK